MRAPTCTRPPTWNCAPGQRAVVPTGIAIALPDGYAAFVHPRSGLAARHGVTIVNAPGTVDAGYRGEIRVTLLNTDADEPGAASSAGTGSPSSWSSAWSARCSTRSSGCRGRREATAGSGRPEATPRRPRQQARTSFRKTVFPQDSVSARKLGACEVFRRRRREDAERPDMTLALPRKIRSYGRPRRARRARRGRGRGTTARWRPSGSGGQWDSETGPWDGAELTRSVTG